MPAKQMIAFYSGHSSKHVLFVEGKTDHLIMEELRERIGGTFDIKMCGGRIALLEVWEALKKYPAKQNQYLFLADQDHWIFEGIPDEYQNQPNLIVTAGYCIENDLYADGEEILNQMLTPKELNWVQASIQTIIKWYAFIITSAPNLEAKFTFEQHFMIKESLLTETYKEEINYTEPSYEALEELKMLNKPDYLLRLPGKHLFKIHVQGFQQNHAIPNFSDKQLLWICVAYGSIIPNSYIHRLRLEVLRFFPLTAS